MAEAPERCLVCGYTDSSTSIDTDTDQDTDQSTDQSTEQNTYQCTDQTTDQGTKQSTGQSTDQGTDQGANSSSSLCARKGKKLYPKIHFCGNIIWICSTCTIEKIKCNHCQEDLIDSQVDTKENLRHIQLFTDLTLAEERENRIIFQNENKCQNPTVVSFCPQCECMFLCQDCSNQHKEKKKDNTTKYHIVKHIERIKESTQNKNSSPCVLDTDKNSDFFCCTHNIPVCSDCKDKFHKTCKVKGFTESLDKTKRTLNGFIEKLESKERECEGHLMEVRKEAINRKLTKEFKQLRSWIDKLENELKISVEDEYNKQCKRQKGRISGHIPLIRRVLESPPDAAFFDMTQTLAAIVESIDTDISKMNDANVQMKFQDRKEDLEEVIKRLKAMRVVSRGSSQGNVMETKNTLYSSARSVSGPRGSINITEPGMTHETKNVVYVYTCTKCHMLYVGGTKDMLMKRDDGHHNIGSVYKHEYPDGKGKKELKHFIVSCVRNGFGNEDQRFMMERLIMLRLGSLKPDGLNERLPPHKDQTSEVNRSNPKDYSKGLLQLVKSQKAKQEF